MLDREVSPEIQYGDLTNLAADALAADESIGEIALARGFVVGSCLTDKHAHDVTGKARGKTEQEEILWHNKTAFDLCILE